MLALALSTAMPVPGNSAASGPALVACTTHVIVPPTTTAGCGAETTACMSANCTALSLSISTDGSWSDRRAGLPGSLRAISGKSALSRAWLMVNELTSGEASVAWFTRMWSSDCALFSNTNE